MKYNFDEVIDRSGTHAVKLEALPQGASDDVLSLWVADMDFPCAEPIIEALHRRVDRRIFGYTLYNSAELLNAVTGWFHRRYGWEVIVNAQFFFAFPMAEIHIDEFKEIQA